MGSGQDRGLAGGGAIAGVLDPLFAATGAPLRERRRGSLGQGEPAWIKERGALAVGLLGRGRTRRSPWGILGLFEANSTTAPSWPRGSSFPATSGPLLWSAAARGPALARCSRALSPSPSSPGGWQPLHTGSSGSGLSGGLALPNGHEGCWERPGRAERRHCGTARPNGPAQSRVVCIREISWRVLAPGCDAP
jgi:hypothetical protein